MKSRTFYGYAPGALDFDPANGTLRVLPGFTPGTGRSRFELDGSDQLAESSNDDDRDVPATVYGPEGGVAGRGQLRIKEVRWYRNEDGEAFSLSVFEIGGQVMGHVPSQSLKTGETYAFTGLTEPDVEPGRHGTGDAAATGGPATDQVAKGVACFGPGTMIATQNGEIPVEWLDTSDKVLTRDDGFQPILWVGRTRVPAEYFARHPDECPVRIAPGALGPNCPTHPLSVTGDHRIVIKAAQAELMFASAEVLAPAKSWVDAGRATRLAPTAPYTVTHILLETHQLIMAEGAWVESMFTGREALRRLDAAHVAQLELLLGDDLRRAQTARPCLRRKETATLLSVLQRPEIGAPNTSEGLRRA